MGEAIREFLYPLGFCAQAIFGGRVLYQWLLSEVKERSVVTKGFWWLSLVGNLLLMQHGLIQGQFPLFILQLSGAFISWRNLNLMSARKLDMKQTLSLLPLILLFGIAIYFRCNTEWFRIPSSFWHDGKENVPLLWHLTGFLGMTLFASRFWVQWWQAEMCHSSRLTPLFFWISGSGSLLSLLYFISIKDPANVIGPMLSLVPYTRNILLLSREQNT